MSNIFINTIIITSKNIPCSIFFSSIPIPSIINRISPVITNSITQIKRGHKGQSKMSSHFTLTFKNPLSFLCLPGLLLNNSCGLVSYWACSYELCSCLNFTHRNLHPYFHSFFAAIPFSRASGNACPPDSKLWRMLLSAFSNIKKHNYHFNAPPLLDFHSFEKPNQSPLDFCQVIS